MDRFNDLEKEWANRQRKRKLLLGVLAIVAILSYAAYTQFSSFLPESPAPKKIKETFQAKEAPAPKEEPKEQPLQEDAKSDIQQKKEPLSLSLNRSFEQVIEKSSYEVKKTSPQEQKMEPQKAEETIVPAEPKQEQSVIIEKEEVAKPDLAMLYIEEYLLEQTYENALKIAKHYYENGHYQKAIDWSLKANKISSAEDESWIVFANSSIKLGLKEQARKALSTYLLKRDSLRVRRLYDEIK